MRDIMRHLIDKSKVWKLRLIKEYMPQYVYSFFGHLITNVDFELGSISRNTHFVVLSCNLVVLYGHSNGKHEHPNILSRHSVDRINRCLASKGPKEEGNDVVVKV